MCLAAAVKMLLDLAGVHNEFLCTQPPPNKVELGTLEKVAIIDRRGGERRGKKKLHY